MSAFSQLAAEALQHSGDGEQDVDKKIEQALACPCLGDLKEGACGPAFVHAFTCFMRSEHEDKGMDCLDQFKDFQVCLQKNPEHLAKIMQGDEERERAEAAAEAAAAADDDDAASSSQQQQQQQGASARQ